MSVTCFLPPPSSISISPSFLVSILSIHPFFSIKTEKFYKKKNFYIGDIAISYEIINSRSKKNNFFLEFDKVWIHGLLHLLGYNNVKNKEFYRMNRLEKNFLNLIK